MILFGYFSALFVLYFFHRTKKVNIGISRNMNLQKIINNFVANPKKLFLIDGLGAVVSAFSLGVALVYFESIVGMPKNVLYLLAFIPCIFVIYSISCFLRLPNNWRPFLKAIATANLLYCCLSMSLVYYFYPNPLTNLGLLYFLGEFVILIVLIYIEFKVAFSKNID